MSLNGYFTPGVESEQNLLEDLIIECIEGWGTDLMYIPRTLVSRDNILNEDRLSEFKNAYPIRGYLEQIDNFEGQGAFIQKFGLGMEQSGTFTIARKVWQTTIGNFGTSILPNRPSEGDLIYWPTNGGLFEIKFVTHQNPFYQLGKLYVYKLEVELFQYASEKMNTGISTIDRFEDLKSHDLLINNVNSTYNVADAVSFTDLMIVDLNGSIVFTGTESIPVPVPVTTVAEVLPNWWYNDKFKEAADGIGFESVNVFGDRV